MSDSSVPLALASSGPTSPAAESFPRTRDEAAAGLRRWGSMTLEDRTILDHIDGLDGPAFERFLCDVFSRLGYRVEQTEFYDRAADLILVGDRGRIAVKANRHSDPVPERAVQAAVAAKAVYGCEHALVVTSSTFTPGARRLARANRVGLWGRDRLISQSLSVRQA